MIFEFDDYSLDTRQRELRRGGSVVSLEPKVFDLLAFLLEKCDRVVTRDELIESVWGGRIVSESALASCINAARAAIQDDGAAQRLIKTFPRKGIRFVGNLRSSEAAEPEKPAARPLLALPERPSIAVLPFQNLSGDPDQGYFADGMVDDIITGLSRIRWLFVIARNSSFLYRDKALGVTQIGQELGVRYVLDGTVRKAGDRIRVSTQLIETENAGHIWGERYERQLQDIFVLQDEITMSVLGAIEPSLRKAEIERVKRKRPENLDAYDLVLQAMPLVQSHIAEDALLAIPHLSKALELQPDYALAHAMLAWCYHFRFSRAGLREEDRSSAIRHARAAVAGGDDATALGMAGFVISLDEHDHLAAINLFDRALSLSPSNVFALSCSALVLSWLGKSTLAIERATSAIRLSPFDFLNYLAYNALALAYFHTNDLEKAFEAANKSVQINPRFGVSRAFLTAVLVGLGRTADAAAEAQRVLALQPGFSIKQFSVTVGIEPRVYEPLAAAWKQAGLPHG